MEPTPVPNKVGNKASGPTRISQASLPPGCQTLSALRVMLAAGAGRARRWKKRTRDVQEKERQRAISLHTRTKGKKKHSSSSVLLSGPCLISAQRDTAGKSDRYR